KNRNHALFGDRLALDLDNAFYIVAESLVNSFREQDDYEGFKLASIVNFSVDTSITKEEFLQGDTAQLAEKIYTETTQSYEHKMDELSKKSVPVFKNILLTQGRHIENVVVPFTDGKKSINVLANLQKTLDTQGRELMNAVERQITLGIIDDTWKEHLRAMDDLKQSVQTAYLEQKDPLVIYKMEAFELFRNMDNEMNREIVSFLCHSAIPIEENNAPIREGREQKTDMSKMKVRKDEMVTSTDNHGREMVNEGPDYYEPSEPVKREPIKVGPKIGRNDLCPCGSGKKYKNCHGKEA
ncbi:MAG TPA: SEC-C metal-binding domain-containing protein, partial [Puia sp.]|nr:SEC-C metal-binding domain-containing protein [Puia sp.]